MIGGKVGRVLARIKGVVFHPWIKTVLAVLILASVMGGALWLSVQVFGVVNALVYWIAFGFGFTLLLGYIEIVRKSVWPKTLGKLHFILGQFAFDHGYLVEFDDRYDWYPGTDEQVWIDGTWYDIEGQNNLTILGFRPFGITRFKGEEGNAYLEYRVDTKAERERGTTSTDGGNVERAGISETMAPAVSGGEGEWLIDMKRVYTRGVRKIGDTRLLETAEEVIERGEVLSERAKGHSSLLEAAAGLIAGAGLSLVVIMI